MAESYASIYNLIQPQPVAFDPLEALGRVEQLQAARHRSAIGALALQEAQAQQQREAQIRAAYRRAYSGDAAAQAPGAGLPAPAGAVQEVQRGGSLTAAFPNAPAAPGPYSSALQGMLAPSQQEGADVSTAPPGAGPSPQTLQQPPMARGMAAGGQAGVDQPQLVRDLMQIDPAAGRAAEKAALESHMGQLEMLGKQNAIVSNVTRAVLLQDTQQAYEVGVNYLRQAGIPVDHLPPKYDRRLVEHYHAMSTDAETRIAEQQNVLAQQKLRFEERRETRLDRAEERQEREYGIKLREEERKAQEAATQVPEYIKGEGDRNAIIGRMMRERGLTGSPPADVLQAAEDELIAQQGLAEGVKTTQRKEAERLAERPVLQRKAQTHLSQLERGWQTVDEDIDQALTILAENPTLRQTGIWGAAIVPGTPGYTLRQLLTTIQANVGFDRLQQMREASPTGGALGQVSDSENRLLQATAGSLDPKQPADQLERNLRRIKGDVAALRTDRRQAFAQEFGTAAPSSGRPPTGTPGRQRVRRATVDKLAADEKVPRATVIQRLRAAGLDVEE